MADGDYSDEFKNDLLLSLMKFVESHPKILSILKEEIAQERPSHEMIISDSKEQDFGLSPKLTLIRSGDSFIILGVSGLVSKWRESVRIGSIGASKLLGIDVEALADYEAGAGIPLKIFMDMANVYQIPLEVFVSKILTLFKKQ